MPSYLNQSVSIQWCNRDEIKNSECDIEITETDPETDHKINIIHEDIIRCSSHEFCIDKHDKNSYDCQYHVGCWSRKCYHKFSFARVFIIEWIDLYGFSSSKMCQKHHKESYRIDMFHGVWCQSSLELRGRISETIRNICMRVFVHTYRYCQDDG